MPEPTVIPPGGGEVIGDSPERRVEILCERDGLHATWSRYGPGREGADLHVHREHSDLFYVLEGELTLRLGVEDTPVRAGAGTLLRVPPLVVHGFRNGSDADVRYLNLHAPGRGFAAFLRGLRDGAPLAYDQHPPPADGGRPVTDAVIGADGCAVEEIAIDELRAEPGAPSPRPAHRHPRSLFVLDGALAVTAGGVEVAAPTWAWVDIPAGAAPEVTAAGGAPARYLDIRAPA